MFRYLFAAVCLLILLTTSLSAQSSDRLAPIPNVYLDCGSCDISYIRSNITFVNYVRDQDDASIYLLINDLPTGGGGREYTLIFSEIGPEEGRMDTLRYVSSSTDSNDERRIGLNRYIKIGLMPYVTNTVAVRSMDIFYEAPETDVSDDDEEIEDPWNSWVFDVNVRSNLNGQSSETNFGFYTGLEAERTTHTWKIRARARGEIRRRTLDVSSGTLNINRDWGNYWQMAGYSLSDHSTIALFTSAQFNRTNNIALHAYVAPAFEYNFFPYNEFQERRFIVQYQLTPSYRRYYNTTVFGKDSELIMSHELSTRLRYDQRWGRIDIRVSGMNYFHDTAINRFEVNPSFNIRIMRGLSVSLSGRYRVINDQLSLEGAIDPDDPTNIISGGQRPTSFDYSISFGLSYTFGSIYNNIVNPRF
ncbi:hypothetical protein [Rhodohalobacter barkolensis]|uniref:hypothetical protein n=1 Tax=Rhodohalobacter barkolensis TaxID=2053187 RepID=UPI00105599AA|nr:hypothetical protein [Rhodohalobacter barkolensis]